MRLAPNVSKYIARGPIEKSRLGVILIKCLTGSMLGIRPIYVTRHSHAVVVAALIRGRLKPGKVKKWSKIPNFQVGTKIVIWIFLSPSIEKVD